ncbi:MAG: hypothetical protein PGN13_01875 [Patulibacter minatonensis]
MIVRRPHARPRARRALLGGAPAALLALPLLLTACGGDSDGGAVDPETARKQLVVVADRLDRCYAKTYDARKCTTTDALGGAPTGDGVGQLQITADRPTRYRLAMKIDDRAQFSITAAPVGARLRECTPAGAGSCPKTGVW